MKKQLLCICVGLAISLLNAGGVAAAGKTIVLKAGHPVENTHPHQTGLETFAKAFTEKTAGRYTVDIYHSAQLGNERDMIEGLSMGTLDIVVSTNAPITGFVAELGVFDMPYLFISREHAFKVLDGEIGTTLMEGLKKRNIVGLVYFENGFRNLTNSKLPVKTPDDMKGLKIRVMESKVHLASFRAFGANPTPMAWSEVFTALQQGTIDGQENPIMAIYNAKIYEVNKYLSLTEHFYSPVLFMINKKLYDGLSDADRKALHEAAELAKDAQRAESLRQSEEYISQLAAKGMIVEKVDKGPFKERAAAVYTQFEKEFGGLIRRIEAEAK